MSDYLRILQTMQKGISYSRAALFNLVKADLYHPEDFNIRLDALIEHKAVYVDCDGMYGLCERRVA